MTRVLTEEHKKKMAEGRERTRLLREGLKQKTNGDAPTGSVHITEVATFPDVLISVDWKNAPMHEAQSAYSKLREEFEKAGRILNERSMPAPGSYKCFMCQIVHPGDARGKDDSYYDPDTGLLSPVRICGEGCWISYQDFRIRERSLRNDLSAGLVSQEEYLKKVHETLDAMRSLRNQKVLKTA